MIRLHGELAVLRLLWRRLTIKRYLASTDAKRLHLGCGSTNVKGWLNVDKYARVADTYLNAYARFPFADGTFDMVYSEHMLEHLRIDKVRGFLTEILRVLKPGGTFRVTCPDLEKYIDKYIENDQAFFEQVFRSIEGKRKKNPEIAWLVRTRGGGIMAAVLKSFHRHHWLYDFETLESALDEIGFTRITKQSFAKSSDPELGAMDSAHHAFETLYVEAARPA